MPYPFFVKLHGRVFSQKIDKKHEQYTMYHNHYTISCVEVQYFRDTFCDYIHKKSNANAILF